MTSGRVRSWLARNGLGVVVVGVAVVAVGSGLAGVGPLAGMSIRHSKSTTNKATTTTLLAPTTPTTIVEVADRVFAKGDCVLYGDQVSTDNTPQVVPCDQPHILEFAGSIDVTGRFDHYPTDAEWSEVFTGDCVHVIETELLNQPLDPSGRYKSGGLKPVELSWANGRRNVACGIELRPVDAPTRVDGTVTFTGSAVGQRQDREYSIGDCHRPDVAWRVSCAGEHSWETTGTVDLGGRADSPPATQDSPAWSALVGRDCDQLATTYLGHPATGEVRSGWVPISQASWDAGSRTVECTVAEVANGQEHPFTGSLSH